MKARLLLYIFSLLSTPMVMAQSDVKQRLYNLYKEAEQSYLLDDYHHLGECIDRYVDLYLDNSTVLGDSLDVFEAYSFKMCANFYYGFVTKKAYNDYAEENYLKSLRIFERRHSTENIIKLHEELAQLYYKTGDYQKAWNHLDTVFTYYDKQLNALGIDSAEPDYYRTLSQLAMCNARKGLFSTALSQIDQALRYYQKTKEEQYFETQRRKGKILMMQADHEGANTYKAALKFYKAYVDEQYASIAQRLDAMSESQRAQHWLVNHHFLYDCFRLGNQAPDMLYNLVLFSKGFLIAYENNQHATRTTWQQVKDELNPADCAIEFVQYFGKDDEQRIGCLVLKNNSKMPQFVDLLSTDSLLNIEIKPAVTIDEALTVTTKDHKNDLYQCEELPQLIWTPQLMAAIGDAKRVLFSPDGFLNILAIEYLLPDSDKEFYRLSSTRVIRKQRVEPRIDKALLCGGMTYNTNVFPLMRKNDAVAYRFMASPDTYIKELPGAMEEVDSIYACRHQEKDMLLTGPGATDEKFLRMLKDNYNIVHISTHGFFGGLIRANNDIKPLADDQAMSKCGILFAGASTNLADSTFDEDLYDGILSAAELSKLDFSKTELVVLSACQTALGYLTDDGLFGVQRGLKQAGANGMLLSLWTVNDLGTNILMRFFYKNLEKQEVKNIHAAFRDARRQLMQEKETLYWMNQETLTTEHITLDFSDPCYANPFILIDIY